MVDMYARDQYERQRSAMTLERSSFIAHYKELSDNIQPRRGRFFITDRNKGDRRYQKIINSKGTQAVRTAKAGLLAGVMSPARPWFALESPDPDMMEYTPVKEWLYKVTNIEQNIFNASNLYNMAPVMLGELLTFATGCMTHLDDYEDVARFYTHTVGSYMICQNERFVVDTICREFEMTVEQIVKKFGLGNVSTSVKDAYDKGNYGNWYPLVHFIRPNDKQKKSNPRSQYLPFESVHYEPGNLDKNKFLGRKGFHEFPAYVPRWDVTGEDIYGTDCPGMTALGDIKGLQIEEKRKAQAIDKMVNPPLKGPASLRNVSVSGLPGGLTTYDGDGTKEGLSPIYTVNPQIGELKQDIRAVESRIDQAFFVDMFLAISNMEGIQPRNEFELAQRNQERLLQIGPVLERLHGEFLSKLIDRTFNQMVRADILPEPPQELRNSELKVRFISTLAMAQRSVATGGIDRLSAFVGGLVKAGLSDGKKFDADQAIDEYASVIGVPPRVVKSDDVVGEQRAQEQKLQQQAQQLEMAQVAGNTAKSLADAKTTEPSALTGLDAAISGKK